MPERKRPKEPGELNQLSELPGLIEKINAKAVAN